MPFHSSDPFLTGEQCKGIYLDVTDRNQFESYKAGIATVWAINHFHANKMVWDEPVWDRLTGTRRLMNMIQDGSSPNEIFTSWENELTEFKEIRKKYLLY